MISKSKAVQKYMNKVSKHLICKPETKAKLMQGLSSEIDHRFASEEINDYNTLVDTFGKPEEFSETFQENVPIEEYDSCKKKRIIRRRVFIGVVVVAFLLLAFLVIDMAMHTEVAVTETITVIEEGVVYE